VSHTTYGDGRVAEVGPYNARRRDYALQVDFDRGSSQAIYTKVLATAAPMRSSVTETKSRPETPVAVAVARELAPLAAAPVTRLVDGWAGKIALRREPSAEVDDRASELMGDPPPARSALAGAEPWRPYEERAHHSGGGF